MPPSKRQKKDMPVCSIVGGDGSLTHQAALEYFSDRCIFLAEKDFASIFEKVASGACDFGMVPIENSNSGALRSVYDLLSRNQLFIVGEHASNDRPCLLGPKGMKVEDISRVYSHPAVLENCAQFLSKVSTEKKIQFDHISVANTSAGCSIVAEKTFAGAAAISTRRAAEKHGLAVLQEDVADDKNLTTRYVILAKKPAELVKQTNMTNRKQSLALIVRNEPGSIFKMLSPFAFRGINVLKLDSRPGSNALDMFTDGAKHWEYVHFLDFEPSVDIKANEGLFRDLEEFCVSVRNFGEYQKWVDKSEHETKYELLWR